MVQQFLDIEAALGMTTSRGVGMGELVDEYDLRPTRDYGVEIHFLEPLISIFDPPPRNDLESLEQGFIITRAEAADLTQHVLDDDLAKIALGSYMLELTDALTTEESEAADAYRVLSDGLGALSTRFADAALRQAFEMRLLGWAGFGLEFTRCRVLRPSTATTARRRFISSCRAAGSCARNAGRRWRKARSSCRAGAPQSSRDSGVLPMHDSPGSEASRVLTARSRWRGSSDRSSIGACAARNFSIQFYRAQAKPESHPPASRTGGSPNTTSGAR